VRLGINTPVIHLNPRFAPPEWESTASVEDLVQVVQEAERLGYDWVSASEHVAIPLTGNDRRGPTYWDPVATLSYVAAVTTRIRLLSHVVVLGYHHPLEIVKHWGTVDILSRGRVVLGVGVGSLEREFALLDREFTDRGERADDALRAIRAAWGDPAPSYAGTHYSFADVAVDPCGLDRPLDIWIGGRTKRSLVRALTLGDGWIPFRLGVDEIRPLFADPAVAALLDARDRPFERIYAPEPALDPLDEPARTADQIAAFTEVGATGFSVRVAHRSLTHYLEQLAALKELMAQQR
jgi:probable F420-dependent oxidoreductase